MATLNLPQSKRARLWRLLRERLKGDAPLRDANVTLLFFEGDRGVTAALENLAPPAVVFVAGMGRMEWFTERSMKGQMLVTYMVVLDGLDDEDPFNLQEAIESALYPEDSFTFHQRLVDEGGAVTGQPTFSQPLNLQPSTAGVAGLFKPTGQFTIDVERGFTP